jgi:hypothetical protein
MRGHHVPLRGFAAAALLLMALVAGLTMGSQSSATAAENAVAQSTTTTPATSGALPLSDPIANALSPYCGDQDGSEPPVPPISRCPDYTRIPNLRFFRLLGTGPVAVRFDYVFRSAVAQNALAVYRIDDSDGSVNGFLPGHPQ